MKLMRWIRILNGQFQADPVDALYPKSGNKKEKFYFIVSTLEGRSYRNRIKVTLLRFPVRKQIISAIIMLKYLLLPLLRRIMLRETDLQEETESASVNCKHNLLQRREPNEILCLLALKLTY